jgi:ribokinase
MSGVIVLGSINEDLVVLVERAPQPGETLIGRALERHAGGKGANQAVAAARLGVAVSMIGAVGTDEVGRRMIDSLAVEGIDTGGVSTVPGSTGLAVVTLDDMGENSIVVVSGANAEVTADLVTAHVEAFASRTVFVVQLEIPLPAVQAGLSRARAAGLTTILNAAPAAPVQALLEWVDLLVVNETEARELAGTTGSEPGPIASQLAVDFGVTVVLTLGGAGVMLATAAGSQRHLPGVAVDVVDTTGAGDTFVGALAAGLAAGQTLDEAATEANRAAAIACTGLGAQSAMPRRSDLEAMTLVRPC